MLSKTYFKENVACKRWFVFSQVSAAVYSIPLGLYLEWCNIFFLHKNKQPLTLFDFCSFWQDGVNIFCLYRRGHKKVFYFNGILWGNLGIALAKEEFDVLPVISKRVCE